MIRHTNVNKGVKSKKSISLSKCDNGFIRAIGDELHIGFESANGVENFFSANIEEITDFIRDHNDILSRLEG